MVASDLGFHHHQRHDTGTTDLIIETRVVSETLRKLDVCVVARVIELVAIDVAKGILKQYKPKLVKLAMRNPDLLSHVRKAALEEAEKIVQSRSND